MKGHVRQRAKGSWSIVIDVGRDPATGKRRQQWYSVKGTKREAEKKLAELIHQLDSGGLIKPSKTTLGQFLERWLKDHAWPNLGPRTAEGYEHIIRQHLIKGLDGIFLTQLKPEHIQRYYREKLASGRIDGKGGLSPRTVRHHHATLHNALESAVKWGLIGRNPADAVTPPRYQQTERKFLDEDDVHTILERAKGTSYYALFYLALFTGMRRSELLALRWRDVDLVLAQISVNRSLHHLRDGRFIYKQPKTAKARRLIALPPSAVIVLSDYREQQLGICYALGRELKDDDLVFSQMDGRPLSPDTVTANWIKLVRRAGYPGIRLHDAMHSHASILLKQNVHPKIVQERLGHASIQITLDTYSHVTPGLQRAAAEKFDEILNSRPKDEAAEKKR